MSPAARSRQRIGRADAGRRDRPRLPRILRLLLVPLALMVLAACSRVDPLMREACIAAVPALEEGAAPITILAVEATERTDVVRVRYRSMIGGPHLHEIACAFGEEVGGSGRRDLVGIRTEQGVLPLARLFVLRRFWLGDPSARAAGLERVEIAPEARPRGLVTVPAEVGLRLQQGLDALAPAALYALLGLSCTLIYGLVGRIVFFLGDLAMLGAFAALTTAVGLIGGEGAETIALVPVTILAAAAVVGAWGRAIGRGVVAPLAFRAATPILVAAVGLSIALEEFVARAQGVRDLHLPPPAGAPLLIADGPFDVYVTPMRAVMVVVALACVAATVWIFPKTRLGRDWRAVADDAEMARLLGIDPLRVLAASFGLAGALAGIGGALQVLAWGGVSFHMGTALGVKAVIAAILGGIGSLPGAALGGLALGFVEAAWTAAFGADWRDVAVFALLVVALLWRRDGLLGVPGRS